MVVMAVVSVRMVMTAGFVVNMIFSASFMSVFMMRFMFVRVFVIMSMASVIMVMAMAMAVTVVVVMITGFTVRVVVRAQPKSPVEVEKIEATDEKHADTGDQRINSKAGIKVSFYPAGDIEIQKDASPRQESENGQDLKEFFHGSEGLRSETNPKVTKNTNGDEK